ncbi:RagB/SusD family nutrient uptake outer membrane protein [Pedobacter sp. BMA]|uniref:RagB/SusD family nutrient uptake outer membrane protein n=1 Tax=Pedobacter sp. BMA TaxID=1663685 RepID=UPI000649DC08|nr:RagB/SusD family nutrient uptake outer membrane protein [Pedobacter sp. BMA]KLT63911.1 hypothetical protein AB669_19470 [Pedobacter sp. BMA]
MKNHSYLLGLLLLLQAMSCKKYLEEKPSIKLGVPTSVEDYQSLLDQYNVMSDRDASSGEASAGEFYLTDADYNARDEEDRRMYTWQNSRVYKAGGNEWGYTYSSIYSANSVIEAWEALPDTDKQSLKWRDVAGQAFLIRAKCYLTLATIWCKAYDPNTSANLPGIPLRLNTNFSEVSIRASLEASYSQVITDLKKSVTLLPITPLHVVRASKPAAYGLLARTYLWMRQYENCRLYADSCLMLKKDLINFNTLTASATYPVSQFNTEVIMANKMGVIVPILSPSRARVNPEVYALYDNNDLRKTIFFKIASGITTFKGSYAGSGALFCGVATDEVYLMRAESRCRSGNINGALADLNLLLSNRYKTGTFTIYNSTDQAQLLNIIVKERRKELFGRGLRWPDMKRLNEEGAGISLSRIIAGTIYSLPAKSSRFAMPIPEDILQLSGIFQNSY